MRTILFCLGSLAVALAAPARAGCTKDTDCKGDRVCENGKCVSPPPTAAPSPTVATPPTGLFAPAPQPAAPPPSPAAPAAPQLPLRVSACSDGPSCGDRCDSGDVTACTNLGTLFENGTGGAPQDYPRAAGMYGRGCDGNDGRGCALLAYMYVWGRGVGKDMTQAARLAKRGCDLGDGRGCDTYGYSLNSGQGAPRDVPLGNTYYDRGCTAGDPHACANLAQHLCTGSPGLTRDAQRGHALALSACNAGQTWGCVVVANNCATSGNEVREIEERVCNSTEDRDMAGQACADLAGNWCGEGSTTINGSAVVTGPDVRQCERYLTLACNLGHSGSCDPAPHLKTAQYQVDHAQEIAAKAAETQRLNKPPFRCEGFNFHGNYSETHDLPCSAQIPSAQEGSCNCNGPVAVPSLSYGNGFTLGAPHAPVSCGQICTWGGFAPPK